MPDSFDKKNSTDDIDGSDEHVIDGFVHGREVLALTPTEHDPGRISIRVGRMKKDGTTPGKGRVVATLNASRIIDLGLHLGQAWTEDLATQVNDEKTYDKAMRQAMYAIGRRALSCKELDRKLQTKGHSQALRERVADRLMELGLLDDKTYAHALVRQTVRGKPAGPRLLKQKLAQKGVPHNIAEQAVAAEQPDTATQREQAFSLAEKRLASMHKLDTLAQKRRIYGLLARRGFEMDVVQDVMERLFG